MKLSRPTQLSSALLAALLAPPVVAQPLATTIAAQHQQQQQQAKPAPMAAASAPAAPKKGPAVKSATPVTLNFVNADIEAVTRAIGVMMDRQFVIDPRVKGVITVYSEQPLPVASAYLNYLAALRGLGFTVVESGGLYKLVPEADAKLQTGTVTVGDSKQRGDQVITQVFKLQHENANNLLAVLRPLISANNMINANPGNNSLLITDYAENLQRMAKIIAAMDTASTTDIEVVPLKHAVASDIAALVQKLGEGGGGATGGAVPAAGGGALNVLADPRSNSLILRASSAARLVLAKAMIEKLDIPGDPNGNIHVVYLKNADATRLATVLRAAFTGQAGSGGNSGSSGPSSLSGQQSPSGSQQLGSSSTSSSSGANSPAATNPVSPSAQPSTGGFVQADPATNSLIITAPDAMYRQIRNVIDQLDTRRAQVYVESMIVKVDATKAAQFGVQWQNLFGNKGDSTITGAGTNFGSGAGNILNLSGAAANGRTGAASLLASGSAVPTGLNIGVLKQIGNFYTLGAIANFLEAQAGANVLSTPNLVALDNEEAKIVIGQKVAFTTGSFTNTGTGTGAVSPFQTFNREDVGLTLRIRSQIGEGGTIRMQVFQENSSVVPGASTAGGPTTDRSAIETTVVVDDGQILVLGGLLKDEYTDGADEVPGLAKIPLIGNLFKSENRKRVKTNLMVFLRPVVLRDQQSANQITLDRYDVIRAKQQGVQPESKPLLPDTGAPLLPATPPSAPASAPVKNP
ncbi:type II secretion system secretin GspD [Pelomonas sp. SE-A7]|uniref:type II secretion system secretin GspD n=1 Tax=Pelomonas sp. SE-A7 TaxID=3054953 RepID=UPI00259C7E7A|nr:type II secretion system secretin GspD [Pelomonas sp. SE-A7]MDM4766430.1 type II secretion system secretin GspD [Pelomonas sp. SE-A7]